MHKALAWGAWLNPKILHTGGRVARLEVTVASSPKQIDRWLAMHVRPSYPLTRVEFVLSRVPGSGTLHPVPQLLNPQVPTLNLWFGLSL